MSEMVLTRHFSAPFSPSYSIAAFILALNSDRAEEGRELLHEREREEQEPRQGGVDEVAGGQEGCAGCWVWSWAAEEAMSVVPFPSLIPSGLCVLCTVHACMYVLELRPALSSVCSRGSTQKNIASAVTLLTQPRSRVGRGAFDGEVEFAEHAPSLSQNLHFPDRGRPRPTVPNPGDRAPGARPLSKKKNRA